MAEIRGESSLANADSLCALGLFLLSLSAKDRSAVGTGLTEHHWTSRVYFDADKWYWSDRGRHFLSMVVNAIRRDVTVEITYRPGRANTGLPYEIEPYGLVWKGGYCYVVGRLPSREMRTFRLDRMEDAAETDRTFEYPAEAFDVREWWQQHLEEFGKGDIRVVLRGAGSASDRLRSLNLKSTSELQQLDNGDLIITLYVDKWDWLIPMACQFGDQLEVVEPEELRSAVVEHLSRALRAYDRRREPS